MLVNSWPSANPINLSWDKRIPGCDKERSEQKSIDGLNVNQHYFDHFISLRLGIPSSHGEYSDLLRLWAAVSQRQSHLPVGGTVCGVGSGQTRTTQYTGIILIKVNWTLCRVDIFSTRITLQKARGKNNDQPKGNFSDKQDNFNFFFTHKGVFL